MSLLDELKKYFALRGETLTKEEIAEVVADGIYKGEAESDTNPGTPANPCWYGATTGVTYQFFLDQGGQPITVPKDVAVEEATKYVVSPRLVWNETYWTLRYELVDEPDMSGEYISNNDVSKSSKSKNRANPANIKIPAVVVSNGVIQTNYPETAAFIGYKRSFGETQFTVSGYTPSTGKYAAFKDSNGEVVGSVNHLGTHPKTFTWPENAVSWDATLRGASEVTEGQPGYTDFQIESGPNFTGYVPFSEIVSSIKNTTIEAQMLSKDNVVPDPISADNALNLRTFNEQGVKTIDLVVDLSTNLANIKNVLGDSSPYNMVNSAGGRQNIPGWKMIAIDVRGLWGKSITWDGINISSGGYSAFYSGDTLVLNNGAFTAANQPRTHVVPSGCDVLYIDVKRPADNDLVYSTVRVNVGETVLPYEPYGGKVLGYKDFTFIGERLIVPTAQLYDRRATFSFIFDDGLESDQNVVNLFTQYRYRCGFALPTNDRSKFFRYLGYQLKGFEILSHSTDSARMSVYWDGTGTAPEYGLTTEQAEQKMLNSLTTLKSFGFHVNGWVTPNSKLHNNFLPIVKRYYGLAYTQYFGADGIVTPENAATSFQTFNSELRTLLRISLESNTVSAIKLCIDQAIANKGAVCFYAHQFPGTLTEATLIEILNYLKSFVDQSKADVLPPTEATNRYYMFRHDELLSIINS
uniref:NodB homology domain-containing protein n=1 Tax=Sphingobacterium sp. (strain 21) TaxID=743722 RepID=F4C2C0_SPHS2